MKQKENISKNDFLFLQMIFKIGILLNSYFPVIYFCAIRKTFIINLTEIHLLLNKIFDKS